VDVLFGFTAHEQDLGHKALKQIILANLGCFKLKATPGVKTPSPAED
jgi:hypothetical protein